jgi:hypothetical protein
MNVKYFPLENLVVFDEIILKFYERRVVVRERLGMPFKEDNSIIETTGFDPIIARRDVYKEKGDHPYGDYAYFFILDYDNDDLLGEIGIFECDRIYVEDTNFSFEDDLDAIAFLLSETSEISILSDGEYFFKTLRLVISSKWRGGGEENDNTLGYFYCAADVSHLG